MIKKYLNISTVRQFTTTTLRANKNRRRQHVNPFSGLLATLKPNPDLINWNATSKINPKHPFHLDLGSGAGHYLATLATTNPATNYIGVEIIEHLVTNANAKHTDLHNYSMVWANLLHPETISELLSSMPNGEPSSISILHPDPNFKKKHKKRDLVTNALLNTLSLELESGTLIYVQTDVEELFEEMILKFTEHYDFEEVEIENREEPLLGVATDREAAVLKDGGEVYKKVFRKMHILQHS